MSGIAQNYKDKGNAAFKEGDYPTAIRYYSAAIAADSQNYTYPLNRAAAHLKLGKYEDAERDCTTVLHLDSESVKAWFRRGQARIALGSLQKAQADFNQVVKLDSQNELARAELQKIEDMLRDSRYKMLPVKDLFTPLRRRVPIAVVDPSLSSSTSAASSRTQAPHVAELLQEVSLPQPPEPTTEVASSDAVSSFKEAKIARSSQLRRSGGGIFRPNGQHTIFSTTTNADDTLSASPRADVQQNVATHEKLMAATIDKGDSLPHQDAPLPDELMTTASMTLFDFTRLWDSLRACEERWALIVKNAPPRSLPSMFKTSLEPSFLISMLRTFDDMSRRYRYSQKLQAAVKDYMLSLMHVHRFSTVVMLMSHEEKAVVRSVWNSVSSQDVDEAETRAKVAWRVT